MLDFILSRIPHSRLPFSKLYKTLRHHLLNRASSDRAVLPAGSINISGGFNYLGLNMEGMKKVYNEIPKSPRDDRLYRGLELNNNMKVLVISDPLTDKSAAALDVHIGKIFKYECDV